MTEKGVLEELVDVIKELTALLKEAIELQRQASAPPGRVEVRPAATPPVTAQPVPLTPVLEKPLMIVGHDVVIERRPETKIQH